MVQISSDLCRLSGAVCIHHSHSTWTSGRNELLRSIYSFELRSGSKDLFKYFAFADDDMIDATCSSKMECSHVSDPIACCFDSISYFLLGDINYAVINFVDLGGVKDPATGEPICGLTRIAHTDCSDGAFNAYHRGAVPALLPYVELVDKYSWWGAQAIMWTVIGGCVPGFSVYAGILDVVKTKGHVNYPKGRYEEVESDAKKAVFGRRGLAPWPIDIEVSLVQGNCMKTNKFVDYIHETAWNSGDWIKTESFHRCYKALKPRFDCFVTGLKNISEIDFIDFGDYATTMIGAS